MKQNKLISIQTLGELKKSNYRPKSVRDELRENLLLALAKGENVFEGIYGYEHSVIPDLERAILSRHHINLLGLRGQAKTMLARMMVNLLDEFIPVLKVTDLNEDPLNPISSIAKNHVEKFGDDTEIAWMHRSERFFEKLATPDVSVADLIGDVDPIKAANLKLNYSDERVIHFGMVPRAHRCIFVINELPDLQPRIQVALFNILQEGDIQIRGFKLRLPVDIQFVFTANPEDYTNRGSIVTPLKDRIGSQILTHYPEEIETAMRITRQEASLSDFQRDNIYVPELAARLLEQISFEARDSEFIDAKSGVSARLSVSAFENLMSSAERRARINKEEKTAVRLTDFIGIIPSITGKVELVYEGEQQGSIAVAERLMGEAVKSLLPDYFPALDKIKSSDEKNPYQGLMNWFGGGNNVDLEFDMPQSAYEKALQACEPMRAFIQNHQANMEESDRFFMMEFLLWALAEHSKLNRDKLLNGLEFSDLFSSYLQGLQ
jgi:magnesium chelatase subunit I